MQVKDIALSRNTSIRFRLRALYEQLTREPRGGQEESWQKKLTELDPELYLRWNYIRKHWSVYYDHHGLLTCITTFEPGVAFGKVFKNLKYNSFLTPKHLQQMKREQNEADEKAIDDPVKEFSEEFAEELHHSTRRRLISDSSIEPQHRKKE
jgi:hypothetical protein